MSLPRWSSPATPGADLGGRAPRQPQSRQQGLRQGDRRVLAAARRRQARRWQAERCRIGRDRGSTDHVPPRSGRSPPRSLRAPGAASRHTKARVLDGGDATSRRGARRSVIDHDAPNGTEGTTEKASDAARALWPRNQSCSRGRARRCLTRKSRGIHVRLSAAAARMPWHARKPWCDCPSRFASPDCSPDRVQ